MVNRVTFVNEREDVVLDGLRGGGRDRDSAGEAPHVVSGSGGILKYSVDNNDKGTPTVLDATPIVSLQFRFFEVIRYPKVRVLDLCYKDGHVADLQWLRVT